MAFDLLNHFSLNQTNTTKSIIQSDELNSMSPIEVKNAIRAIASLLPGQSIQGELIQKDGNNIQLLLQNNFILNTKLDQDLNLNMGQLITFEVKGNQNGQLLLRPLFENIGQDANISKALEAAGLKETDQTVNMVNELMNQGMPVNKEILLDIFRQSNKYPQAEISDIIMLHKMQLPVNENNILQMHLYQNNNHWMIENLNTITDQLFLLIENTDVSELQEDQTLFNQIDALFHEVDLNSQSISDDAKISDLMKFTGNTNITKEEPFSDLKVKDFQVSDIKTDQSVKMQEDIPAANKDLLLVNNDFNSKNINNVYDLIMKIKKGFDGNRSQLQKAVFDMIKSDFLLEPQKVNQKDYINRYYEKLSNVTSKLEALLKESGKGDTAFAKTVSQIKNNVSFINQMNELYHYIQLPLKMNDRHANGELHVFTKKHKQLSGDDNLTALLHLSMEYLGNMDIYLSLQGEHLNTRFCLEKEEMIDFIEQHLNDLNVRLSEKGYVTNTEVSRMNPSQNNVLKTILGEEQDNRLLSKQSFDARA